MRTLALILLVMFVLMLVVGCVCNPEKCTCSREKRVAKWGEERVRQTDAARAANVPNPPAERPISDGAELPAERPSK
jgi:hypothetical protein